VVGSRTTYYSGHDEGRSAEAERKRRDYVIFNVARWINNSLVNERETRGQQRAFVRYTDLLDDWRPVLTTLRDDLGLRYDVTTDHNAVDDFIDPGLRRHTVTWDELDVPRDLEEVAQAVWDAMQPLADNAGVDAGASARLDELATEYARVVADAAALDHDGRAEAVANARTRGGAEALEAAHAEVDGRPVRDLTAGELAKVLARRVRTRLSGRSRT